MAQSGNTVRQLVTKDENEITNRSAPSSLQCFTS